MGKGYVLVEGHGETLAVENLLSRLWADLELPFLAWEVLRWLRLHQESGVAKGCEYIRRKGDADALLILRDEDDACPRDAGPMVADWVATKDLPFPTAAVLMHREYEVLFLPCIHLMAGVALEDRWKRPRPGLRDGIRFAGNPESIRGVKEWLSARFASGRSYKPTLDQLSLTRMIDFDVLRAAKLPCFGTLERALSFLSARRGDSGVYPSPRSQRGS